MKDGRRFDAPSRIGAALSVSGASLLAFAKARVIKELQSASRVICERLRKRPYNKAVRTTAWDAVVQQLLDGRRRGAFSWQRAVKAEILCYIAELDEGTKRKIWESHPDSRVVPNADLATITECLYPIIFQATLPRIHRAVEYRRKRGEAGKGECLAPPPHTT